MEFTDNSNMKSKKQKSERYRTFGVVCPVPVAIFILSNLDRNNLTNKFVDFFFDISDFFFCFSQCFTDSRDVEFDFWFCSRRTYCKP